MVAIGCTGGRHRSVAIAEHLAALFRDRDGVLRRGRAPRRRPPADQALARPARSIAADQRAQRGDVRAERLVAARRERDPGGAPPAMDALAALDVVDVLERGRRAWTARSRSPPARRGWSQNSASETAVSIVMQLEPRGRDDVRVELGHQALITSSARPAIAATAEQRPATPRDSPRPWTAGSRAVGAHPPAAAERVRGAAGDRPERDEPPARRRTPPRSPPPSATAYDTDAGVPVPSTTRLAKPPSQTPLSRRNRASCTPATATKIARPAASSHGGAGRRGRPRSSRSARRSRRPST